MAVGARDRFLSRLPLPAREAFGALSGLDADLQRLTAEVRTALPDLRVDEAVLAEALGARITGEGDPASELGALHAADIHLADACARGESAGLRAFDRLCGNDLDRAIARSPNLGLTKPEFRQLVHEKLFVQTHESPPRIASYGGSGALRGWVRVMAARMVVDLARRQDEVELIADDALLARMPGGGDPELVFLRHAYGEHLSAAFTEALAKLTVRQRNLLRQRHLHGLKAERLAALYGVHRGTIFTWLEGARTDLLALVRAAMSERAPEQALESVVALLGSQLDVSVRRLLDSGIEEKRFPG